MKSYLELNNEEKNKLEELINEVRLLLPDYYELFSSEKLDLSNNIVLYTEAIKLVLSLIAIPKVLLPRSKPKHLILNTHSSYLLKLKFYLKIPSLF